VEEVNVKATRRLAVVGAMALSAVLTAGPAYAGGDPGTEVECHKVSTNVEIHESQQAYQSGLIPLALNDVLEKVNVGIAQDLVNDLNVEDVTIIDNAALLSPGATGITCR
jgi:hypothetical protein